MLDKGMFNVIDLNFVEGNETLYGVQFRKETIFMKQFFAVVILALVGVVSASAQVSQSNVWDDEEFAVEFVYRHANAKLEAPTSAPQLTLADPRNSLGFRVGYTHFFGRKDGRGNLGIGVEGGATFSNNDAATVDSGNIAIGRGQYKLVYMDNRPNQKVRLGGKLTAGIAREQFKYRCSQGSSGLTCGKGQNAWTLGAGTFVDFGEGRRRLRLGAEYYYSMYTKQSLAFPERSNKHNVELSAGLVF